MKTVETVPVFVRVVDGRTVCICCACSERQRRGKFCRAGKCVRQNVTRDIFEGWRETMIRDRYGR